jgi:putative membrane protein
MSVLISWLVLSLSVWLTSVILPGFTVKGFGGAIRIAAIFGILNWALGKLIFGMIAVATLFIGLLFTFVTRAFVNAILLMITSAFSDSLKIKGFGHAVLGAVIMSGIGTVAEALLAHSLH